MPELPEVETTRRGIQPHLISQKIKGVIVRQPKLRWPVPEKLSERLKGQQIVSVKRRGKYLLIACEKGTIIIHLGMSGSLKITTANRPPEKHDHIDLILNNGKCLRFRDPRRFGAFLWTEESALNHSLLINLGPEPFDDIFDGNWLKKRAKGRRLPVKSFIMNSHIVTGVGNIYASEALFLAGIRPDRSSGAISLIRYQRLANAIRKILQLAINQGGTTLRDFVNESGQPGYFQQQLAVYGREDNDCLKCESTIKKIVLGNRSTFYCPKCQH